MKPRLRRSGVAEIVLWVLLGLIVVSTSTAVIILTSTDIVEERVRLVILEQASKRVDAEISIGSVSINYLPFRLTIGHVTVDHPSEGRFFSADSIEVEVDVISLLTDEIHLTEVAILRPQIHVNVVEGKVVNMPAMLSVKKQKPVILESLNISNGLVLASATDTAPWPLDISIGNLNVDITGENNKLFEVRLLAGSGEITAGEVHRTLDRIDLRTTLDTRHEKLESRIKYVHLEMLDVELSVEDGSFTLHDDNALSAGGKFELSGPLAIVSLLASRIPALEGTIECKGQGSYGPGAYEADASCSGREIKVGRSFIGDLDLHAKADQSSILVDEASVRQAGGELRFTARLAHGNESMDVKLDGEADGLRFAELATNVGLKQTRVQFSVRGPIEVEGTLRPLDVSGNIDWTVNGFRIGTKRFHEGFGQDILRVGSGRVRSRIGVTKEAFRFENALVTTGKTSIRTSVAIGFKSDLHVKVDSSRMNLKDVHMPGLALAGQGSLDATIAGSLKRTGPSIKVDSKLDFKGLHVAGVEFGNARGRLKSDTRKMVIEVLNVAGSIGSSRYRVPTTRITFRPPWKGGLLLEGEVLADNVHIPDVRRAFALQDVYTRDASGAFCGDVTFVMEPSRKREKLLIDATGSVSGLSLLGQQVGGGQVDVLYDSGYLELRTLALSDGEATLTIQGTSDPDTGMDLEAHLLGLNSSRIAAVDLGTMGMSFVVDLDGHIGGPTSSPVIDGAMLVVRDLVYQNQSLGDSAIGIDLADEKLTLSGSMLDARIALTSNTVTSGRWPTEVSLFIEDLVVHEGPLGVEELTEARGKLSGTIEASLKLADGFEAVGTIALSSVLLQVPDYGIQNEGIIEASFTHKGLFMDKVQFVGEGTRLGVTGSVQKPGPRLQIAGQVDLALLSRFVPQIMSAEGTLSPRVGIGGDWKSIEVAGELDLDCAKLAIDGIPVKISDVKGQASFNQGSMAIDAAGKIAGGSFTSSGTILLDGFYPSGYDVYADFNDVSIKLIADIPMGIEGRLALQGGADGETPLLSGDVWVTRFRYTEDIVLASIEDIGVVKPSSPVLTYDQSDEHVKLDIVVHGYENLEVVNNVADVDFRIDETQRQFRLVGTDARPVALGSIMVTKGTVTYQKKSFEVTRGVLEFTSNNRIDPDIDIIAVGEVRDWRLTLQATGTYSDLKVLLNSDPPLSDEDIVCLLATDMTCEEAAEGLGFIGALGLNQILGQFASIEQFKVVPVYDPETGKAVPMVLLKQKINEKISVSALSSLGSNEESGQSAYLKATVAYKVNDNLSIEGFYDTKGAGKGTAVGNVGLELSWRLEF